MIVDQNLTLNLNSGLKPYSDKSQEELHSDHLLFEMIPCMHQHHYAVTLGYQYWIKNHLATMDVKTALRLPIFQDLNTTVAIDVDILWHNTLRIGAYDSGSDAVLETFSKMKQLP
jgi:hypothetical protein